MRIPLLRFASSRLVAIAVSVGCATGATAQDVKLRMAREIEQPPGRTGVQAPTLGAPEAADANVSDAMGAGLPPLARPAPAAAGTTAVDAPRGVVFLRADRLESDASKRIEATGAVELRTRHETVLADWLQFNVPNDEVWAKGDVTLRKGRDWISGPEAKFQFSREIGFFDAPEFFISDNESRGKASEIRFVGAGMYEASNAQYTTCVAPNNDWYLRADEIEVDRLRKVGVARGASVHFLGAPVLYTPWLEFPLSNERKSGFLTPTIGSTQIRGFEVAAPYYFNLAPNYDLTLTPRLMTRRGVLIGAEGRYLFAPAAGEVVGEVVPQDRIAEETRWAIAWKHQQSFAPWLTGYVNFNRVSDSTYLADFADRIAVTSQRTLPGEAGLNATHGPWSMLVRTLSFQTLQDPNPAAAVVPPYNMLPQVRAALADTDALGLTWSGTAEYVRFAQDALIPTGDRVSIHPSVRWIEQGNAWFVTARASVAAWQYNLDDPTPGVPTGRADVVVPVTSVDGGLVFERDLRFFDRDFVQTLEPRAMYTYIPYRNQSALPIFDTVQDDFNFTQLFSENRFIGGDRVGDTNQLALAVTSRLLDPATGAERLRVAVGQRFYFDDQQVALPGTVPQKAGSSDFLVGAEGRLADAWSVIGLMQYDFGSSQVQRLNLGTRYNPAPGRVVSFIYRYSRELVDQLSGQSELKQTYLSGQWPLSESWTFMGAWNYSFPDRKTLEAVLGLEYNGGCWALRVVGQQLTTSTETRTNAIFVQLELNGLARVGTSPLELLRRTVPGYLRSNDPTLNQRDRSFDPLPEF
ncbi:MAG: LPS-assembly protein LptD [Burkholderiales bacterium]|nr:LPS-assembly protein LptD [Burkholderiales bacterium]